MRRGKKGVHGGPPLGIAERSRAARSAENGSVFGGARSLLHALGALALPARVDGRGPLWARSATLRRSLNAFPISIGAVQDRHERDRADPTSGRRRRRVCIGASAHRRILEMSRRSRRPSIWRSRTCTTRRPRDRGGVEYAKPPSVICGRTPTRWIRVDGSSASAGAVANLQRRAEPVDAGSSRRIRSSMFCVQETQRT